MQKYGSLLKCYIHMKFDSINLSMLLQGIPVNSMWAQGISLDTMLLQRSPLSSILLYAEDSICIFEFHCNTGEPIEFKVLKGKEIPLHSMFENGNPETLW